MIISFKLILLLEYENFAVKKGVDFMNMFRYLASKTYRNRFYEEYSREFTDKIEAQQREYENIYKALKDENSSMTDYFKQ